jgi:hypothetical protein
MVAKLDVEARQAQALGIAEVINAQNLTCPGDAETDKPPELIRVGKSGDAFNDLCP